MNEALRALLEELGFSQLRVDGDTSLWVDASLSRAVRVHCDDDRVELMLLQDVRYYVNSRGPVDAALVQALRHGLKAHARAREAKSQLDALEQGFRPLADALGLELVYEESRSYSLAALRYRGAEAELALSWDNFPNELHARYRSADIRIDQVWKNGGQGRAFVPLDQWAGEVAIELRALISSA